METGQRRAMGRARRAMSGVVALLVAGFGLLAPAAPALAAPGNANAGGSTLVTETFKGASVPDARWVPLGDACLTGAQRKAAAPAGGSKLPGCQKTRDTDPLIGQAGDGYLQLTDNSGGSASNVLYDRAVPVSAGLDVSFYQYQFSKSGNGVGDADGIGFFLVDGSYTLDRPGPAGGGLGYAAMSRADGVPHGVLAVGLDAYGNFSNQPYVGPSCTDRYGRNRHSVVVRGSGNGLDGYCVLGLKRNANGIMTPAPTGRVNNQVGSSTDANGTLVRIVLSPAVPGQKQTVTVYLNGAQVLETTLDQPLPPTVKMGFTGSTGGGHNAHLLRELSVKTIKPLGGISLVKTLDHTDATGTAKQQFTAGDIIPYSFVVTNTGAEPLSGVTVSDPKIADVACPSSSLAPADSMVCSGKRTLTDDDIRTGTFTNTATASGTTPSGARPSAESSADAPTYSMGRAFVVKKLQGSGAAAVDAATTYTVNYSYPAGAYNYCTAGGTLTPTATAAGYPAGSGTLRVKADGTAVPSDPIPVGARVTLSETRPTNTPAITWDAPAIVASPLTVGCSQAASTATITNTASANPGSVAWTKTDASGKPLAGSEWVLTGPNGFSENVVDNGANDADPSVGAIKVAGLAWGQYSLKEAKAPEGYLLAAGEPKTVTVGADALNANLGAIENYVVPAPGLSLEKSVKGVVDANKNGINDPGDQVTWAFHVSNTGNTRLDDVSISDPSLAKLGVAIKCPVTSLKPGESTDCVSDPYTITPGDAKAGKLHNEATATGSVPSDTPHDPAKPFGPVTTPPSKVDVPTQPTPAPSLALEKTVKGVVDVNKNGINDPGDQVTWSFHVTNTGNTVLNSISIADPSLAKLGVKVSCPVSSLKPGESTDCVSEPDTITADDAKAGKLHNEATATGSVPSDTPHDPDHPFGPVTTPPSSAEIPTQLTPAPSLALEKKVKGVVDANKNGINDPGDEVTWTFHITNAGNTVLNDVKVDDSSLAKLKVAIKCPVSSLKPGESTDCTSDPYTLTPGDAEAGKLHNEAIATASVPSDTPHDPAKPFGPITTPPSSAEIPAQETPAPSLALEKKVKGVVDANKNGINDPGDQITWSFHVTNTGNTVLDDISISDPSLAKLKVAIKCPVTSLKPGESADCTSDPYTITADDAKAGKLHNEATATASVPSDTPHDPDHPFGPITTPPSKVDVPTQPTPAPSLALAKKVKDIVDTNKNGINDPGDEVTWSFHITNTGNTVLNDVKVDDPSLAKLRVAIKCPVTSLKPGESTDCTSDPYTLTEDDAKAGKLHNEATATASVPSDTPHDPAKPFGPITTPPSSAEIPAQATPAPSLALEKKVKGVVDANKNGINDPGDQVTWAFHVTNTGNTVLDDVKVDDPSLAKLKVAIKCPVDSLKPGESTDCVSDPYTLTEDDAKAGKVHNEATATASVPSDIPHDPDHPFGPLTTPPSKVDVPTQPTPAPRLALEKKVQGVVDANKNGINDPGDLVTWSFHVTNTGNTVLNDVKIADPSLAKLGVKVSCPVSSLKPGESTDCVSDPYTITADDAKAGKLHNEATATGSVPSDTPHDPDHPFGPITTPPSSAEIPAQPTPAPSLALEKKVQGVVDANKNGINDPGDQVTWSFHITNRGNIVLNDVKVDDPSLAKLGVAIKCPVTSLRPGESTDCVSDPYTLTSDDAKVGKLLNEATATATVPPDTPGHPADPVSAPSRATLPVKPTPSVPVAPARPTPATGPARPTPAPAPTSPHSGSRLAFTGYEMPGALSAGGLVILGLGAALVATSRSRKRPER